MTDAGLAVREDAAGNVFGTLPGTDSSLPCIMAGSHYDSVRHGGNYDGIAGVIGAIELARVFREEGIRLRADYVAAAFMDEEGCRFGNGYFGSKCMLGQVTVEECRRLKDKDQISVYDAMKGYGLVPENLGAAQWKEKKIGHFMELHIEQGPVLDQQAVQIGLVDCIVGIRRYMVTVLGRPDHAGTTPMDMRKDAVETGSRVISQIGDMAREYGEGTVATVGYINVASNAVNVVADRMEFSIDIRSAKEEILEELEDKIRRLLMEKTKDSQTRYTMEDTLQISPVRLSETMLDLLEKSCQSRGFSCKRMPSGAGHDSLAIGQVLDTVMIFVPSKEGRSHCPQEYTPCHAFSRAVMLMKDLVLKLQQAENGKQGAGNQGVK